MTVRNGGPGVGWNVGEYKGRPIVEHGGGYVGCAAHLAILPEQQLGVAVLSNTDTPMPFFVLADVLDRFLGETELDWGPRMATAAQRGWGREEERIKSYGSNPSRIAETLTLSPGAYVGSFKHTEWGFVTVAVDGGDLRVQSGDLPWSIGSSVKDEFTLWSEPGLEMKGRFVVSDQAVNAIELEMDDGKLVRFDRAKK